MDRDVNNILSIFEQCPDEPILNFLLGDAVELKPPSEDRTDFEKEMEKEMIDDEERKLMEI